jgi:hypothetical protein
MGLATQQMPSSRAEQFAKRIAQSRGPRILVVASLLLAVFSQRPYAQKAPAEPMHTFHDRGSHVSFEYPAGWVFAERDHEISTFHLDARTAPRKAQMRAVVAMPENPFPASTFSGAYVYFSVTPHISAAACVRQAAPPAITKEEAEHRAAEARAGGSENADSGAGDLADLKIVIAGKPEKVQVAGIAFMHGRDEQREVCITQRDDVYTTRRKGACVRFDLAINNFCGGEMSGVRDMTPVQLEDVRGRLKAILETVRFEGK